MRDIKLCAYICVVLINYANSCKFNTFTNISSVLNENSVKVINGCFNSDFKSTVTIQIKNQTVPILYEESFYDLPHLTNIILLNLQLTELKANSFKNLSNLYSIKIAYNNIKHLTNGVFNNLTIRELNLMYNQIEDIDSEAFNGIPNLAMLNLSANKIQKWDADWFQQTPNLNVLNFMHNLIRKLPTNAFQHVQGTHLVNNVNVSTSIHLNSNKIEWLENGTFAGLDTLGWLFLQRNQIREFNVHSLGNLRQLDWLKLDYNELKCIPEKLLDIAPNVKYYLKGNPLTAECIDLIHFHNTTKRGLNKFKLIVQHPNM